MTLQDFHMLVADPRKQKLYIQVKDSLGFTDLTIGRGEVNILILWTDLSGIYVSNKIIYGM